MRLGYKRYLFECYKMQDITWIVVDVFWDINGIYLNVIKEQDITWYVVFVLFIDERYLFECYKRSAHDMDSI